MSVKVLDKLNRRAFEKLKWSLTAMSGALATGMIIILET